jgi:acyl carrier protein
MPSTGPVERFREVAGAWGAGAERRCGVEGLELELRALIQQACDLDDARMATLTDDDPLVGPESPLGLDSLDALEIVTAVQRQYSVRIDNQNTSLRVLQSLRILADFIRTEKATA